MESSPSPMDSHAAALVEAADGAIEQWVVDAVRFRASEAGVWNAELAAAAQRCAADARAAVMPRLRELLVADIDEQRTTPLAILRSVVPYATSALRDAGVPPSPRDEDQRRRFPHDDYDLTPVTFADFGPDVGDAGLAWGAAKAFVHRQRHGGSR